jgi:hypothetical protein
MSKTNTPFSYGESFCKQHGQDRTNASRSTRWQVEGKHILSGASRQVQVGAFTGPMMVAVQWNMSSSIGAAEQLAGGSFVKSNNSLLILFVAVIWQEGRLRTKRW